MEEEVDYVRVVIAKWTMDHTIDLAVKEIRKTGTVSKETKELWQGIKQEYLRVQKNVTDSAKYRFNLFSFMSLQDIDDTDEQSNNNLNIQGSVLPAYRQLVDTEMWNDEELEALERFDHLLRQQAVKQSYVKNGASCAKKVFNNLWKSEPKAKYAAIKNSLRDMLAGKTEVDVEDEASFSVEALNALEILASKLEQPYLHLVVLNTLEEANVVPSDRDTQSVDLPKDMDFIVSGTTLFNAIKQVQRGKEGQPLYLGKKSLTKFQEKCSLLRKKKRHILKGLSEYFPDYQCNLDTKNESSMEQDGENSESDTEVPSKYKSNKSPKKSTDRTKERDLTPGPIQSPAKKSPIKETPLSSHKNSPRQVQTMSSGKRQLYNPKRKLLLDSDSGADSDSDSYVPPSEKKSSVSSTGERKRRKEWTSEEVDLLLKGVAKYGPGRWAKILQYTRLKRTNVNLKDKWRTINKNKKDKA